jgi:6-phosphogluconolactonase (cycloisomerase 2 family)
LTFSAAPLAIQTRQYFHFMTELTTMIFASKERVYSLDGKCNISLQNPSFIKYSNNLLFCIEEAQNGSLLAYDTTTQTIKYKIPIPWPCSISTTPVLIATANYSSSSITICTASLVKVFERRFDGSSISPRQQSSHPHEVYFDGDIMYVPDLGMDCIHLILIPPQYRGIGDLQSSDGIQYQVNTTDTIQSRSSDDVQDFVELDSIQITPGYGPRHMLVIGNLIYLVAELVSHLVIIDKVTKQIVGDISLLQMDYDGAAEIQVYGDIIFVSVRNTTKYGNVLSEHGWIVSVNTKTLKSAKTVLKGKSPRFFKIINNLLYCLFQDQDFCQIFRIDGDELVFLDFLSVGRDCQCLARVTA